MTDDNPLRRLTAADLDAGAVPWADLGDRRLVEMVIDVLTEPPAREADSFVLHAPLELMARVELLPHVAEERRPAARARLASIAVDWLGAAPMVPTPADAAPATIDELTAALSSGSLDDADRALVGLASTTGTAGFVAAATDVVATHLGGAAHASIFLDQLGRFPHPPPQAVAMGRALVRDLARHPDWSLRWVDRLDDDGSGADGPGMAEVLAAPPSAGDPGSNFIQPTMDLVDRSGLAAELLGRPCRRLSVDGARRELLRVAAMSMLQDDPAHAPYGWTHCLTMPQATLAVAPHARDPRRSIAVAATYVLGFRATQSTTPLDMGWSPPPATTTDPAAVLGGPPAAAAAGAWHLPAARRRDLVDHLATAAACHHDAHLAKYTVACLRAAADDPEAAPMFLAAAASLVAWWQEADTAVAATDG